MRRLLLLVAVALSCAPGPDQVARDISRLRGLAIQANEAHKQRCTPPAPFPPSTAGGEPPAPRPAVCGPLEGCVVALQGAAQQCHGALQGAAEGRESYAADVRVCQVQRDQAITSCRAAGVKE